MKTILAVIMLTIVTLSGCSSDETPADTTGVYVNDNFRASIEEDVIVVQILGDESEMLYWQGTWDNGKADVTSDGDREALDSSLMGSGADEKEFTIKGDSIQFEFQAMGTKSTETLKKD